jgi:hypothetical protein
VPCLHVLYELAHPILLPSIKTGKKFSYLSIWFKIFSDKYIVLITMPRIHSISLVNETLGGLEGDWLRLLTSNFLPLTAVGWFKSSLLMKRDRVRFYSVACSNEI